MIDISKWIYSFDIMSWLNIVFRDSKKNECEFRSVIHISRHIIVSLSCWIVWRIFKIWFGRFLTWDFNERFFECIRIKNKEHKIQLYISKREMHRSTIRAWRKMKNDGRSPTTMSNYKNFNETKRCSMARKDIVLDLRWKRKILCVRR